MNRSRFFGDLSNRVVFVVVLAVPLLWGCEDASLDAPPIQDELFNSYAAIGNSTTAGIQSGGIDSQTQSESYAVLLADQMSTPFRIPRLRSPGCPPPYTSLFNQAGIPAPQRPGDTDAQTCALRDADLPPRINNVAVPGAKVIDVLSNEAPTSSPNPLTQFILGGKTQIEAALEVNPTFATVWVGNNDVLVPAQQGTADATPVSQFRQSYSQMLDRLESHPSLQGGVLIGVANVAYIPYFSPGPVYLALDQAGQFPPNFEVDPNCGTRDSTTGLSALVSLEYGFSLLGQAVQNPTQPVTLDCQASTSPVLTLDEVMTLAVTVREYNSFIEQQADQRDLAYLDPNEAFRALYTNDDGDPDPTNDLVPKFPDRDSDQPFGQFFSLDGIHPTAASHRLLAAQLVRTINEAYGTSLSPPENVPEIPGGGP